MTRIAIIALCCIAPFAGAAEGRFGEAFVPAMDGRQWAEAKPQPDYKAPPFTVECWARLDSRDQYNILVANESKASSGHWEIYANAGDGVFSAFLPGYHPTPVHSTRDIADGTWHYLAMTFDGVVLRLYVDAEVVAEANFAHSPEGSATTGPLTVGIALALDHRLGCDGLIDEVRISSTVREISSVPEEPFTADAQTVGLWHFDNATENVYKDASTRENPMQIVAPLQVSLDEIDRAEFKPGPSPLDSEAQTVRLEPGSARHPAGAPVLVLDGEWDMAEEGEEAERLGGPWSDALPATVPGSVHGALVRAGRLPDPAAGRNDALARAESFKTWWFRKTFVRPEGTDHRLIFGGIAVKCTVWLNGERLGEHEGMFGGPDFDIADKLQDQNTLVVRIDPAPHVISTGEPNSFFKGMNVGWLYTVVFNNVYGWHYSNIPALGIWRSVRIESAPAVRLEHPFVATHDAAKGEVDLVVECRGPDAGWSGVLTGTVEPENFEEPAHSFTTEIVSDGGLTPVHLRMAVPDAKAWWPVDLGDPNLYRLRLSFTPQGGGPADVHDITFGIRTVEMASLPGGPHRDKYNWTFVVNGRAIFVKGANWCTMDPLMDFSRERYDRLLTLAAAQHVQMLRAWGSGMPETDDFYDLCDRKGIMVLQEWPTAWNSHKEGWQPYAILEETVRLNTLRLRNHPSLVMWGGGNESGEPFGPAIDMMGRYSVELDGTRAFHRGEPWGGSRHDYACWWGKAPLDNNLSLTSDFLGEFGIASMPVLESVLRYLPDDEKHLWPAPEDGSFDHHTPVFNKMEDVARLKQYSGYFSSGDSLEEFVLGSQFAQATGVRHTLELARTRRPECTGALYYKLNDNYPAASWATVDWYGAPKAGYYFIQDAFEPLHACVLFDTFDVAGKDVSLPVYLLDDAGAIEGASWKVQVRAYDAALTEIAQNEYTGQGTSGPVTHLGEFSLSSAQTQSVPLLLVVEVWKAGVKVNRTFYWLNFEAEPGCLFSLPPTTLEIRAQAPGTVTVTNAGTLPAVGVLVEKPGEADTFYASDGYLWLDPGESATVEVNRTDGVSACALNVPDVPITGHSASLTPGSASVQ